MGRGIGNIEDRPQLGDLAAGSAAGAAFPNGYSMDLPAMAGAVPIARRYVGAVLQHWDLAQLGEAAELLTSELVTNGLAVSQGVGGWPSLQLCISGDEVGLWIAVADRSEQPLPAGAAESADDDAENGRGLFLVEQLSAAWGTYELEGSVGKVVWCRLAVPLPRRSPQLVPTVTKARVMRDPVILRRVRTGLERL
jgi:anti-sigma regulatory factor (Ser/Thr protein kinase)